MDRCEATRSRTPFVRNCHSLDGHSFWQLRLPCCPTRTSLILEFEFGPGVLAFAGRAGLTQSERDEANGELELEGRPDSSLARELLRPPVVSLLARHFGGGRRSQAFTITAVNLASVSSRIPRLFSHTRNRNNVIRYPEAKSTLDLFPAVYFGVR